MPSAAEPKAVFFPSPAAFRAWLAEHHDSATELWVGFHKRHTSKPSLTWPQSVDQALCYGWIDGVRKSLGSDAYMIRFTPRKPTSIWSAVNIRRAKELAREGLMTPAGTAAFGRRRDDRSAIYAYEQRQRATLPPPYQRKLAANAGALRFFQRQPPSYRHLAAYYVTSAKKEETRERRLAQLIECSARGERLPGFSPPRSRD